MKSTTIILCLLFIAQIGMSQEYSFPLYFEDAVGNKDTLYFGFDESATFNIDESLDEVNIISQPYDSAFFTFFTDAVTKDSWSIACNLEFEKHPSYLSKQQYINIRNSYFIEIGIIAQNWPLKISWEKDAIASFNINNYSGYLNVQLIFTARYPPGGWFDAICCGFGLPEFIVLSDTANYQINQDQLCTYSADFNSVQINLFYIGVIDGTTSISNYNTTKINCWYDEKEELIRFQNINPGLELKFELYDLYGSKIINRQFITYNQNNTNIDINHLKKGIYLIRLSDNKNKTFITTFKVVKR